MHTITYYLIMVLSLWTLSLNLSVARGNKSVHVSGYTRKDGAYVKPHYRSPPSGRSYGGSRSRSYSGSSFYLPKSSSSSSASYLSNDNYTNLNSYSPDPAYSPTENIPVIDRGAAASANNHDYNDYTVKSYTPVVEKIEDVEEKPICVYKAVMTEDDLVACGIYRDNRW